MKKNITLADIANACGTSSVTVSNALTNKKGVSEELRERICRTAEELGYVYLRTSSPPPSVGKTIGVLVPSRFINPNGSFYGALYNSLVKKFQNRNMLCVMEILEYEDELELKPPIMFTDRKISAVISLGQVSDDYARMLTSGAKNIVMLDYYIPSVSADCVISNGYNGAYKLCSYLIEMGHRKIGYIGSRFATSSIFDRYMGYLKAMIEHGLKIEDKWTLDDRDKGAFVDIKFPDELPTAFVCNRDETAFHAIKILKSKGYSVPDDISIAGYDNYLLSEVSQPAITTVNVDADSMAELTVEALLERINSADLPFRTKSYEGELVIKDSVKRLV